MISIVDDDPSVCRALKRLLRSLGHDVEAFCSAQEFLSAEREKETDCLILDIHMEGLSGFELQHKLIEKGRNIPIIFITAHDDDQTRRRANRSGAVAYLRKPFDDESLIDAIQKASAHH